MACTGSPAGAGMHHAERQLFQYTIDLSVQKNRNSKPPTRKPPQKPKVRKPPKKVVPKERTPRTPKPRVEPTPAQVEAKEENRRKYERKRRQTPERKELRRRIAQARRDEAKKLGICKDCPNPTVPDQTRCETCAEKHRQTRKRAEERAIKERNQASGQASFL